MEIFNLCRAKTYKLANKIVCPLMIAMLTMSFANCSKDDDRTLVGTAWSTTTVWPDTGDTGEMEFLITSPKIGIISMRIDGVTALFQFTFSYYKDGGHWQMMDEDGNSVGRFSISGNSLFWHRTNGTTLTFFKNR